MNGLANVMDMQGRTPQPDEEEIEGDYSRKTSIFLDTDGSRSKLKSEVEEMLERTYSRSTEKLKESPMLILKSIPEESELRCPINESGTLVYDEEFEADKMYISKMRQKKEHDLKV